MFDPRIIQCHVRFYAAPFWAARVGKPGHQDRCPFFLGLRPTIGPRKGMWFNPNEKGPPLRLDPPWG